jgi:hypothetical protein
MAVLSGIEQMMQGAVEKLLESENVKNYIESFQNLVQTISQRQGRIEDELITARNERSDIRSMLQELLDRGETQVHGMLTLPSETEDVKGFTVGDGSDAEKAFHDKLNDVLQTVPEG